MVARGRRGRGLIRPSLSSSQGTERVERTIRAVDKTTISGQPALEEFEEVNEGHGTESEFAPKITAVMGAVKSSSATDWDQDKPQEELPPKSSANSNGSSNKLDSTSEFEFKVDDSEMAEFDVDNTVLGTPKNPNTLIANDRKVVHNNTSIPCNVTATHKDATYTNKDANASGKCVGPAASTSASAAKTASRKSKRKFGLEYILVSLNDASSAPASMKESPHECVLCLPGQSFNATLLAKHIHSADHLRRVLELHSLSLFNEYRNEENTETLYTVLCQLIPMAEPPVKLLVVPSSNLQETRARTLKIITARKESLATCSSWNAVQAPQEKQVPKRTLEVVDTAGPSTKRPRPGLQATKPVLLVGDERAKELYDAYPAMQEICTLAWFPSARISKLLSGSIIALNSSHRVLIIIGLQNDFVTERTDGPKKLFMVNPNVDAIEKNVISFTHKIRAINPNLKLFFTIPNYIDFIDYSKRVKLLSKSDFERLEDFSRQIMTSYKRLNDTFRSISKSMFCYNMNITLRSKTKDNEKRLRSAADHMQFPPGTLSDGFRLSPEAIQKIAIDLHARVEKVLITRMDVACGSGPEMIQSWADCDNIIVIGDHQTFKFDSAAPTEVTKNVTLISERFQTMATLLERADKMLNPSVDLLVVVGFYREFAQNVINGRYTILEPQVPVKDEIFGLLLNYKKRWTNRFPRLTVVFTIPHVVDFFQYNTATNPEIQKTEHFTSQMNIYTHQFSINIMSFYKELRPVLTMGTTRIWLYHITNSLFEGFEDLLQTIGNFNVKPQFPPHSTLDGFKPGLSTALRLRANLIVYISKLLRKNSVPVFTKRK